MQALSCGKQPLCQRAWAQQLRLPGAALSSLASPLPQHSRLPKPLSSRLIPHGPEASGILLSPRDMECPFQSESGASLASLPCHIPWQQPGRASVVRAQPCSCGGTAAAPGDSWPRPQGKLLRGLGRGWGSCAHLKSRGTGAKGGSVPLRGLVPSAEALLHASRLRPFHPAAGVSGEAEGVPSRGLCPLAIDSPPPQFCHTLRSQMQALPLLSTSLCQADSHSCS